MYGRLWVSSDDLLDRRRGAAVGQAAPRQRCDEHHRRPHRGARRSDISAARCDPRRWPATTASSKRRRSKARDAELTDLPALSGWSAGTRLIVRRELSHPGAQRSLFDSDNFCYWGFLIDAAASPAQLDRLMTQHADLEDAVARLKHSRQTRMLITAWDANDAWTAPCAISTALVHWFRTERLKGPPVKAAPKRLRCQLRLPPPKPCSPPNIPTEHPAPLARPDTAHAAADPPRSHPPTTGPRPHLAEPTNPARQPHIPRTLIRHSHEWSGLTSFAIKVLQGLAPTDTAPSKASTGPVRKFVYRA